MQTAVFSGFFVGGKYRTFGSGTDVTIKISWKEFHEVIQFRISYYALRIIFPLLLSPVVRQEKYYHRVQLQSSGEHGKTVPPL